LSTHDVDGAYFTGYGVILESLVTTLYLIIVPPMLWSPCRCEV